MPQKKIQPVTCLLRRADPSSSEPTASELNIHAISFLVMIGETSRRSPLRPGSISVHPRREVSPASGGRSVTTQQPCRFRKACRFFTLLTHRPFSPANLPRKRLKTKLKINRPSFLSFTHVLISGCHARDSASRSPSRP